MRAMYIDAELLTVIVAALAAESLSELLRRQRPNDWNDPLAIISDHLPQDDARDSTRKAEIDAELLAVIVAALGGASVATCAAAVLVLLGWI